MVRAGSGARHTLHKLIFLELSVDLVSAKVWSEGEGEWGDGGHRPRRVEG